MSRPRFLADHDVTDHIVGGVLRREPSVTFHRARELGLDGKPDDDVLEAAALLDVIVVTHDSNTMTATAVDRLRRGAPLSGVIVSRQSLPDVVAIDQLIMIWAASEHEEWRDKIDFLPL